MKTCKKAPNATEFFCTLLPAYGEFSPHADVNYNLYPPEVRQCLCDIDVWPKSSIFGISPCIFVQESLADSLAAGSCSGFMLRDAILEPSRAFKRLYKHPNKLPRFMWCDIVGQPGEDDFGLDRKTRLIVSVRVKQMIESGPHEAIIFIPGMKAPPDEEIKRILFEKTEAVARKIYQSRTRRGEREP